MLAVCLVLVAVSACDQARQFVGFEVALPLELGVALDALRRIGLAPMPLHCQARTSWRARQRIGSPHKASQRLLSFGAAPRCRRSGHPPPWYADRSAGDVVGEHLPVVIRGARPLARQVLGLEPVAQLGHGRRRALGLDLGHGIFALVDRLPQPPGLGTGGGGGPVAQAADGVAALPAVRVRSSTRSRDARGGDAGSEASTASSKVSRLPLAGLGSLLDQGIGEAGHPGYSCVRPMSGKMLISRVRLMSGLVRLCKRKALQGRGLLRDPAVTPCAAST